MDQWDSWMDEYVKELLPETESEGVAPQPAHKPDTSGGWYTGERKHPPRPRKKPAREHIPPQDPSEPAEKKPAKKRRKPTRGEKKQKWSFRAGERLMRWLSPGGENPGLESRWLSFSMGSVAILLLGLLLAFTLITGAGLRGRVWNEMETRASACAAVLSETDSRSDFVSAGESWLSAIAASGDAYELQVTDETGSLLCSSGEDRGILTVVSETNLQKLTDGKDELKTKETGEDSPIGSYVLTLAVRQGDSLRGCVRVLIPVTAVSAPLQRDVLLMLLGELLLLAGIFFVNRHYARHLAGELNAITATTRRIADGSFGTRIEKEYEGEIGALVNTINDMSMQVKQAEKMKSEFISSVSHELRTPLTAINGWGETLLREEVTDHRDVKQGLAIIVSEAKRLTKMVEELLEFSRIEDGRFTLQIEPVDIKAELGDAVYTYREFFRKKGITLEYNECEEEFPPIPADPERLRQVFSNLLDNAAKHGGSGRRIIVTIRPDGEYVMIRIRDYGNGIPEDELPHVKTKFYKGSSKARGSGIGLAVCDEIAQRHNGSLDIGNAVGGGCVVTLHLPLHGES